MGTPASRPVVAKRRVAEPVRRRHGQWGAAVAGLLLLFAGAVERQLSGALAVFEEQRRFAAEAAEPRLRVRIVEVLRSNNRRLDVDTSERIADSVLRCSREHLVPADLVMAVMLVESTGRQSARSPKGAIGLMQVMPYMFESLELPGSVSHIESNIEAGCLVLADNIRRLGEADGISAYFWGGNIRGTGYLERVRAMRDRLTLGEPSTKEAAPSQG